MKKFTSNILKVLIAASVLAVIGILFGKAFSNPITPVDATQMYNALCEKGYTPQYAANLVSDDLKEIGLTNCVVAQKDDIKINFYSFDNDDAAKTVYNMSVSLIHSERRDPPTRDYSEGNSNHWRYTLIGKTMYSTTMYVGNTAVYAYSDTQNAAEINAVLKSIGYTKTEGDGQSSSEISPLLGLLLTAIWFPLMLICRKPVWPLVYRSSGTPKKEVDSFLKKNSKITARGKAITWLIKKSVQPQRTVAWAIMYELPLILEIIAIIVAFINIFTDVLIPFFNVYIFIVIGTSFAAAIVGNLFGKNLYQKRNRQ